MNSKTDRKSNGFKLNYKRTFIIGFAFFGILLLWQVYDSWCPTFLTELFKEAFNKDGAEDVQYIVGCMMALDNLAALIMLPIFGRLSDKTHTKIGKRMPYILVGTFCCAIAFPFVPIFFHYHNLWGTIFMMAIVVFFAMMYRNPAVALMPDITPKPLRSKANGIINIMGYIGGAFATVVGIIFVLTSYLGEDSINWINNEADIWLIELPFLIASLLMVISALVLFFSINENKLEEEMKDELERGEKEAAVVNSVENDENEKMSKANKIMLILILLAEFMWFMSDNGISTFIGNYTIYYLKCSSRSNMINTIVGGVGSVIGFLVGGMLAGKIGRKWTIFSGLGLSLTGLIIWLICSLNIEPNGSFPVYLYVVWAIKGFGMSLVHVNSYPMVVELCSSKKIGKFTGYYYAASMAAQTITPIALGSLLLTEGFSFKLLPLYALILTGVALVIFIFVKNVKVKKEDIKTGLEALDVDD